MNLSSSDKPIGYSQMENTRSTQLDWSDSEKNETQEYKRICKGISLNVTLSNMY